MLYLAEVQKKSGFNRKAELKLLACQRGEQNWSAVSGDEVIPADEANKFNEGALLLVNLNANKQVQDVKEAGRQLVSILQTFSRQMEKFKTEAEEIEQWKQSLTFQSQELNRREMELQALQEQSEQLHEEAEHLEQQRQEIDSAREEANRLREEMERNRQELDAAWEQLRNGMRQMEEQQGTLQQKGSLDEQQAGQIQELLDYLSGATAPTESVREQLNLSFDMLAGQQSVLDQRWQQLEQQRSEAQQRQDDAERFAKDIQNRWQEWHESQRSLEQGRAELKVQQSTFNFREEYARALGVQLQKQEELHQQLLQMSASSAQVMLSDKVDVEALERMPVEDLQSLVQNLHQDLEKFFRFVNGQEEELTMQRETIQELEKKLGQSSDSERWNLQRELTDEQEAYAMLNETLVGQRRTLREREEVLNTHQGVLSRRLGNTPASSQAVKLALGPVLGKIEEQRQQQAEELQRLESEMSHLRQIVEQSQESLERQASEQDGKRNQLKDQEQLLLEQRQVVGELFGRVNLYQEILQPTQDYLNQMRQKLEEVAGVLNQVHEAGNYQQQAIAQMREVLMGSIASPST